MKVDVRRVDPRGIQLLAINPRFMRHETYQRLVENVKNDDVLTSVPFCVKEEDGSLTVLSGNHRVKAAVDTGLEEIYVMVTEEKLTPQQRVAIQISHNSLTGEDDPAVLKQLYESLDDVDWRMYAGLDDAELELLASVQVEPLGEANLDFQTISVVFLPEEVEKAKEVFGAARKVISADEAWQVRWSSYDELLEAINEAGGAFGVTNVATCMELILDVFERHLSELEEGLDTPGRAKSQAWVPISALVGSRKMPLQAAEVVRRALRKMVSSGDVSENARWQALELWAANYLSGADQEPVPDEPVAEQ